MRYAIALILAMTLTVAATRAQDNPAQAQPTAEAHQASPPTDADDGEPAGDAETPPPQGDEQTPAQQAGLTVTVVSVTGRAQYRQVDDDTSQWLPLAVGDELSDLTVIRTGLGARVILRLADRGEITIRNAAKIGIASFRQGLQQHVTARIGLKYGSIHAEVDDSHGPNDFQVRTPVATLSVGGTGGDIGFSYRGLGLFGTAETWHVATPFGDTDVDAGESTDENVTPSGYLADARRDTQMGDPFGGLTQEEIDILLRNGGRSIFGFFGNNDTMGSLFAPGTSSYSNDNSGNSGNSGSLMDNSPNGVSPNITPGVDDGPGESPGVYPGTGPRFTDQLPSDFNSSAPPPADE